MDMKTNQIVKVLTDNISKVIKGKEEIIKIFVCTFLSGGHVLLDDIPGVGKTTMVKALAKLIKTDDDTIAKFKRLQCTPDLLPYDITGVEIFNAKNQEFEFMPGPVFCDIFLTDELNRTPPKVQSALLEVMAERQVTIGRETHKLSKIFFTAATQNPVESLGTYPLPAAQLDRFMTSISLGYPNDEAALEILRGNPGKTELEKLEPVVSADEILNSREEQAEVFCHPALEKAIIDICNSSRKHTEIELGASPRASLHILALARTLALANERDWIEDKDISELAPFVLTHRCIFKSHINKSKELIKEITNDVLQKMNKKTDWSKSSC